MYMCVIYIYIYYMKLYTYKYCFTTNICVQYCHIVSIMCDMAHKDSWVHGWLITGGPVSVESTQVPHHPSRRQKVQDLGPCLWNLKSCLPPKFHMDTRFWPNGIIFHQPGFAWNKGISLTKPPFGVRSCEVAIIWPEGWPLPLINGWNNLYN